MVATTNGSALREAMTAAMAREKLSVSELARRSGFDRGRIYAWWRGDATPTRASLRRICDVLGLNVEDLLTIAAADDGAAASSPAPGIADALMAQSAAISTLAEAITYAASQVIDSQRELPKRLEDALQAQHAEQVAELEAVVERLVDEGLLARLLDERLGAKTSRRPRRVRRKPEG